jgi:hypothetical protein
MTQKARLVLALAVFLISSYFAGAEAQAVDVDLSAYHPDCSVTVHQDGWRLSVDWPMGGDETGRVVIDLREGKPLFEALAVAKRGQMFRPVLESVDPVIFVVVGERRAPEGRPPGMSIFNVFFDSPANRRFQSHRSSLQLEQVRASSQGQRATVAIGTLTAGCFTGEWQLTFYAGVRFVHVEAVVSTREPARAFLYDAGLVSENPAAERFVWFDTEGTLREAKPAPKSEDTHLAVRYRTIVAQTPAGSVACFPPPHQYFFPRDLTENQKTVWYGRNHRGLDGRSGFGICQTERGGGSFVPWFNAPPGTFQRLGVFYLLSRGTAKEALGEALKFTNRDRFPQLEGYQTFTSHYHMALAGAALEAEARGRAPATPDFLRMFKDMGVSMVHLAEFHGDGHPQDPGPLRLPELQAMFDECRRLSDSELLLIPGEETNLYLGLPQPGRHAGHWMYLFPRPVYWTMNREPGQPFRAEAPGFGPVYHVSTRAEMVKLLELQDGLAWTANARIKSSSWSPDVFRNEDFFRNDRWLGAAWKAMPSDLSELRLGRRVLDLFNDMSNWGASKQVLGEVDIFRPDHTHELYGHMNINYVQLETIPQFRNGWRPLLESLRAGRFFVTTGEVLIPSFTVDGEECGGTVDCDPRAGPFKVRARLRWTFPLRFAELISGDGKNVFRQRIELSRTGAFGDEELKLDADLPGRTWVRFEAWDVACNGAFTQPVWLRQSSTPR